MALVEGMCVRARARASPSPSSHHSLIKASEVEAACSSSDTLLMGSI